MLFWEQADMERLGVVHHLMVLSFQLQHPSRYSPEMLQGAKQMLVDFLEHGVTPQQMRVKLRDAVDSGKRKHKITGTPEAHGVYERPVAWTMRAGDVVAGGSEHYVGNIAAWARSILGSLRTAGEIPAAE